MHDVTICRSPLWAPSHVNYNLTAEPIASLLRGPHGAVFVAKVGMDTTWCYVK